MMGSKVRHSKNLNGFLQSKQCLEWENAYFMYKRYRSDRQDPENSKNSPS